MRQNWSEMIEHFLDEAVEEAPTAERVQQLARDLGFTELVPPIAIVRRANLEVDEVVEVGVGNGPLWHYEQYKDLPFLLVDPRENAVETLARKPATMEFVAAEPGPGRSLLLEDGALNLDGPLLPGPDDTPPDDANTLNALIKAHCKSDRIFLKLNHEGREDSVLEGLGSEADRVVAIVANLPVRPRQADSFRFVDFCEVARRKGFDYYSLMNPVRPVPTRFCETMFLRADHPIFDHED